MKTLFVDDDYTIFSLPVQTSSVQTDHEAVRRARNQEEGKGSKGNAWKVNEFISNLFFVRKCSVLTDDRNIKMLTFYLKVLHMLLYMCYFVTQKSMHWFTASWISVIFQEKGKRRRNWGSRKSKAWERMAEKLWGASPSWRFLLTCKWKPGLRRFLNGICFVNYLSGNKRWACGQLEDLSSQRQEEQGEEEQVLPQAPESKDGAEGMMLWNWTFSSLY